MTYDVAPALSMPRKKEKLCDEKKRGDSAVWKSRKRKKRAENIELLFFKKRAMVSKEGFD